MNMDPQEMIMKSLQEYASDAVVIMETDDHDLVKFSNNRISITKSWQSQEALVFASIQKRNILTSMRDFSEQAIENSVKGIVAFAKNLVPNQEYAGIAAGPFKYRPIQETFDPRIKEMKDKSIDLVEGAIQAALNEGAQRTAGTFEIRSGEIALLTSNGCEGGERGTSAYFSLRALAEKDASGHKVAVSRMISKMDIEEAAKAAGQIAVDAKDPRPGKPGVYDVLFDPLPAANLLENFGNNFCIMNIESGLSCLDGKLGKRAGSPEMTFYDDGTYPNGMSSSKFDAEGVPTRKNVLVENGTIKTFLHNTSTAKRHNTKTTANAGLIAPEPTNLIVEPGKYRKEEMIERIKHGLYITNLWYTRFQNYKTGDFSTIPRDGIFFIRNGRISYPVRNMRISENIMRIMRNIEAVGKVPEQVRGWEVETPVITPPILVKNVRITKPIEGF